MSVSNELSSDIASAVLAARNLSPEKLKALKDGVIKAHWILRDLESQQSKELRYPPWPSDLEVEDDSSMRH
jgi:hypothetical protein